jgi:DNA primase
LDTVAGRIRESDIAQVRERNRIDEVIGEYVALQRAGGAALKGLCPFHDEKSPSLNVRPSNGTFHCFGCGVGGDVIAFVMQLDHLSFVEAVERLADRVGVALTYEGGGPTVQRDRGTRARLVEAHKAAAEFYAEQLRGPEAAKAREYLTERGFDAAAAATFGCGFAPSGWDKLTKHLLGRGFELTELYKAQLSREGRQGPIDRFHRRLLWAIKDLTGDVVGFGARRIFDDDPIAAKYLNTSESPVYKKSQVLFGLDLAKREIAKRHQVVVVEGYTDVMSMHLAGVPTAVATCGTAFGTEHISVLRRLLMDDQFFRGEVIFTFDGDEAGKKAAMKAFEEDQRFAAQTFIAVAPGGMDPCELRQAKGDQAVRDLIARRQRSIEFWVRAELGEHDLDTAEGRVEALRRAVPVVARIKEEALRDEYARQLAGWVGWEDIQTVVRRVRETAGGGAPAPARRSRPANPNQAALAVDVDGPPRPPRNDPRLWLQREALKAALQLPEFAGPYFDNEVPGEAFTHPAYVEVYQGLLAAGGTSSGLSGAALVEATGQNCPHQTVRSLVTELAVEALHHKEPDARYVGSLVARMIEGVVGGRIAELKSKLQRLNPIDEADEYRARFGELVALEEHRKGLKKQAAGETV